MQSKIILILLACVFGFAAITAPTAALSAEDTTATMLPQAGSAIPDTPAALANRSANVSVEHEGMDSLGAKLAFELKDLFNTNSLFTLTEEDAPKLKLILSTASEFPARPNLASAYAAIWTFSQGAGTLNFLLTQEVGAFSAEDLDALVARLAEKTDGIAVRYSYLLNQ